MFYVQADKNVEKENISLSDTGKILNSGKSFLLDQVLGESLQSCDRDGQGDCTGLQGAGWSLSGCGSREGIYGYNM